MLQLKWLMLYKIWEKVWGRKGRINHQYQRKKRKKENLWRRKEDQKKYGNHIRSLRKIEKEREDKEEKEEKDRKEGKRSNGKKHQGKTVKTKDNGEKPKYALYVTLTS